MQGALGWHEPVLSLGRGWGMGGVLQETGGAGGTAAGAGGEVEAPGPAGPVSGPAGRFGDSGGGRWFSRR